jgi:predicted membrane protein DUF2142
MRTGVVASSLRRVLEGLRRSNRRAWWTSFVLVSLLSGLWALANPPYAAPDEPAHVIRAVALDHGQLTGKELTPRLKKKLANGREDSLIVRVPAIYGSATQTACFPYSPDTTAACLEFSGSTREVDDLTYVARHPPAYYAAVGVASWLHRPGSGVLYLMRFLGALMTGALIATAIAALRRLEVPALAAAGLLFAVTPMVLFTSSVVNPSGLEIAASIAVWVCGLVLVSQAHKRVDHRLVTAVGIAGCLLALTRQLGPLWLGLIALTMLAVTSRTALRNLARSNWARLWALLIVASSLVQVAWNAIVKPLDVTLSGRKPVHFEASEIVRISLGASFGRYRDMIGMFGWLDTPAPALTWLPWTAGIAFLLLAALVWATRRQVATLLALLAAAIAVPVIIESATFNDAGGPNWQGRYTLPLAVGIPILAGTALSTTKRGRSLVSRRIVIAVGVIVGVGHVLAFAQNLRRYTVGYDGPIQFWRHPDWAPPVSPLLLTIGYAFVAGAFVLWVLSPVHANVEDDDLTADQRSGRQSTSEEDLVVAVRQA